MRVAFFIGFYGSWLFLAACAVQPKQHVAAVSTAPIQSSLSAIRSHIDKNDAALERARGRVVELKKVAPASMQPTLAALAADIDEAVENAMAANNDVTGGIAATNAVQKQNEAEAAAHNAVIDERNKLAAEINKDRAEIRKLKMILCGAIAAIAALVVTHFPIPIPYKFFAIGGAFAAVFGLAWAIL